MGTKTISIHIANTISGEYDVKYPLPKPLHCDPASGKITRPIPGREIDQIVGFAVDPDEFEVDILWNEWARREPLSGRRIHGLFAVVLSYGEMATLPLPVSGVSVDGVQIGAGENS